MIKVIVLFLYLISLQAFSNELKLGWNYVKVDKLNVRESPSSHSKIVGTKIFRQMVIIEEFRGDWARIADYTNSTEVFSEWIFSDFVTSKQPERLKSKYENNMINEHIIRTYSDLGKYFLVYIEKTENTFITIHQRIGKNNSGYTKTEINCANKQYRVLDYTERHIEYFEFAKDKPSKWTKIVFGSSKSDLVTYVCDTRG
ncbi:SH3 domain-containing protein [Colwellia sp. D2M02]|uniref:SH3 domain-containing protein n=1 Tax=Colwellia sp. D2M02 TaxID=2841562 RepID=UPI001C0818D5|nr:SH3 domain-containing protein [Colwellia sp. D2M02]MBU2894722.1 SH3 domain-containing protein [Colwellia sp. D2M02]